MYNFLQAAIVFFVALITVCKCFVLFKSFLTPIPCEFPFVILRGRENFVLLKSLFCGLMECLTYYWALIFAELRWSRIVIGEGNGSSLQYSCLGNPVDSGQRSLVSYIPWVARVGHGLVTKPQSSNSSKDTYFMKCSYWTHLNIQFTLEPHRFELHTSTYIYYYKYCKILCLFPP